MTGEEELFRFVNPNENDMISEFEGFDLSYFFDLLKNYLISYRYCLNLEDFVTFGFEIECERAQKSKINKELKKNFSDGLWYIGNEETVYKGGEVSTPILTDCKNDWESLEKVCDILVKYANEGETCGGHIHIGSQVLGDKIDSWLNFIKLWSLYEKVIFRFGNGEYLMSRLNINEYASTMAEKLRNSYEFIQNMDNITLKKVINLIYFKKYEAINFLHVKACHINKIEKMNTIEFRSPNGTLNPIIWQNNLNFFVHLLKYSRSSDFNYDYINELFSNSKNQKSNIYAYEQVYISDALKLVDLIFNNNLDKINFLKQYFKNFQKCFNYNFEKEKLQLTRKK